MRKERQENIVTVPGTYMSINSILAVIYLTKLNYIYE